MGAAAYPEPPSFNELVAMLPDALHREMHVEWYAKFFVYL